MSTLPKNSIFRLPATDWSPTLKVLNDIGVTLDHFSLLRANNGNNDYARYVGRAFTQAAFPSSTDTRIARLLLGKSLVDMCDWVAFYSAHFTRQQMRAASKFQWHEDILMSPDPWEPRRLVKDTHTAFLGVEKVGDAPLTVAKLIEMHPVTGQPKFYFSENLWHVGQPHTDVATLLPRWYLLRTEIVPGSTGQSPDEQVKLLPVEYELPTTIAETTKDLLVFRKTGIRPNPSRWARCSDMTVETNKVPCGHWSVVGVFGECGLCINVWDSDRYYGVGCGAARKLP